MDYLWQLRDLWPGTFGCCCFGTLLSLFLCYIPCYLDINMERNPYCREIATRLSPSFDDPRCFSLPCSRFIPISHFLITFSFFSARFGRSTPAVLECPC